MRRRIRTCWFSAHRIVDSVIRDACGRHRFDSRAGKTSVLSGPERNIDFNPKSPTCRLYKSKILNLRNIYQMTI